MTAVSMAALRQKSSSYLHRIEAVLAFLATAHRRLVAHVLPAAGSGSRFSQPTRQPTVLLSLKGVRLSSGRTAVSVLLEERAWNGIIS